MNEVDPLVRSSGPEVPAERAGDEPLPHATADFAHNSERQFAKLLDFYGIAWRYEPHTFVLEHNAHGDPTQAFSPDFYLPAYDLYIEITTLKQKLVTKKNRKVRRLLEQHPEMQVKILYQRDYLHLLVKYGLEAPSQRSERLGEGAPLQFDRAPSHRDAEAESA